MTGNYFQYPTGSNTAPTTSRANIYGTAYPNVTPYTTQVGKFANSASLYGTFDQGGNVWEWNDTIVGSPSRGLRGGAFDGSEYDLLSSYRSIYYNPTIENNIVGFRVASVPEPGSITLLLCCAIAGWIGWRRWR